MTRKQLTSQQVMVTKTREGLWKCTQRLRFVQCRGPGPPGLHGAAEFYWQSLHTEGHPRPFLLYNPEIHLVVPTQQHPFVRSGVARSSSRRGVVTGRMDVIDNRAADKVRIRCVWIGVAPRTHVLPERYPRAIPSALLFESTGDVFIPESWNQMVSELL